MIPLSIIIAKNFKSNLRGIPPRNSGRFDLHSTLFPGLRIKGLKPLRGCLDTTTTFVSGKEAVYNRATRDVSGHTSLAMARTSSGTSFLFINMVTARIRTRLPTTTIQTLSLSS
jgi:hypothetical protein